MGLLVALGCAAVAAPSLARGPEARRTAVAATIVAAVDAPDTLVVAATWQAPGTDGRGPLDSLVVVVNAAGLGTRTTLAPGARAFERRQPLDAVAQAGQVSVCVLSFRGGVQGGRLISAIASDPVPSNCGVTPFEYVPPAPPTVAGVAVSAVRVP
jgi:hypothetical protein